MALSQRLQIRQSQALVMTPQLMQAIKLLQLSSLDLAAYVEGELERNPLLERGGEEDAAASGVDAVESESDNRDDTATDWIGEELETSRSSLEQGLGTELENVFPDDGGEKSATPEMPAPAYSEWSGTGSGGVEDGDYNLEAFVSAETTLAAHLGQALSRMGRRVLLVDADFGLANLDMLFGVKPVATIEQVLDGSASPRDALVGIGPNLWLLPAAGGMRAAAWHAGRDRHGIERVYGSHAGGRRTDAP